MTMINDGEECFLGHQDGEEISIENGGEVGNAERDLQKFLV